MDAAGDMADKVGDGLGDLGVPNPLAMAFQPLLEESIGPIFEVMGPEAGKQVYKKMSEKFAALQKIDGLEDNCVTKAAETLNSWTEEVKAFIPDVAKDIAEGFHKVLVVLLRALKGCIEAIIVMLKESLGGCLNSISECIGCDPLNTDDVVSECFSTLMEFLKDTIKQKMDAVHVPDAVQNMISLDASPDEDIGPSRTGENAGGDAPEQLETE